jgi:hypothetical protein
MVADIGSNSLQKFLAANLPLRNKACKSGALGEKARTYREGVNEQTTMPLTFCSLRYRVLQGACAPAL